VWLNVAAESNENNEISAKISSMTYAAPVISASQWRKSGYG
jgi:hypothetical protein